MNVAIYGGTFDPVHSGHVAVARAAASQFKLGRIYFVPADVPPHKQKRALTAYYHRYALLALALAGEKNLLPSLLEAPEVVQAEGKLASYSIDTVRRFRQRLGKRDKLFFLVGIDAFLNIATWRDPELLLRECEFIVASRPGFSLAQAAMALPESMRPREGVAKLFAGQPPSAPLAVSGAVIHFLAGMNQKQTSTEVRKAAQSGRSLARFVPEAVADYILKERLYRAEREPGAPELASPGPGAPTAGTRQAADVATKKRRR